MADEAEPNSRSILTRSLMTPGLLLLAILGWFWLSQTQPAATPITKGQPTATPAPNEAGEASVPVDLGLVGAATPWAVSGAESVAAAATESLAMPVGAPEPIVLLGPPAGSLFRAGDVVSFYWQWPRKVAGEQQFTLYIAAAGEPVALAEVVEANLGATFQAQAAVGTAMAEPGVYQWWVILQDSATGVTLGQSAPRPIGLVGG